MKIEIRRRPLWKRLLFLPRTFVGLYRFMRKPRTDGTQMSRGRSAYCAFAMLGLVVKPYTKRRDAAARGVLDIGSFLRGIGAMKPRHEWPNWAVSRPMWSVRWAKGFWLHLWTPMWHEGRGPYVSIGLGVLAIYRGY